MKNYCFILLLFTLSFYAQNDTISVVKHTDKDIVVNKESKIVYRGMPNDLYINVPNCKSFTVTAEGLKKITNYYLDNLVENYKNRRHLFQVFLKKKTRFLSSISHM